MKFKFPLLTLTLTLLCALPAFGYALLGQAWTKNRTVLMHLSLPAEQFSSGMTWNQSAEDALNIWNQYLTHIKFAVVRGSALPASYGDADNSVLVSDTVYGKAFGLSTLAVTLRDYRGNVLTEADVLFKESIIFDDYRGPLHPFSPAGRTYDFHRVALHEFGHVVGLDHPDQDHPDVGYVAPQPPPVAIMNANVSDTDSLQQDDIDGGQSLYSSGPAYLTALPAANLVNLSTRGYVEPGDKALIGGFIVQGSQPATVVLRAIGHSLSAQGISAALTDPVIELHGADGHLIAMSDDWVTIGLETANGDAETIASYHLDPSNSRESALIATLAPGNYTAVIHAFDGGDGDLSGTGLFELYDLHTSGGRAVNLSTRGQVLSGNDVLIGGFIIGGNQPKAVAARALGPSLGAAGVAGALTDPALELRDVSGNLVGSNNDWQQGPNTAAIQAEGLALSDPREAALQATLTPGNYTAIVRGNNGAVGIGLVELYDLSPAPQ